MRAIVHLPPSSDDGIDIGKIVSHISNEAVILAKYVTRNKDFYVKSTKAIIYFF